MIQLQLFFFCLWGRKSKIDLCKTLGHDGIHDSDQMIIPLFIQVQILDKNKK